MEVRVLGPIEVWNGHRLALGGPTQRRIIGVLALHAGSTVSVDRLVELTWPDDAVPTRPESNLRTYVSRIRQGLGDGLADRIETAPTGYRMRVGAEELDAERFASALVDARRSLDGGHVAVAIERLDVALAMWHGRPYDEFADEEWARAEVARLLERRATAEELRLDAHLAAGRAADVATEVGALIHEHPEREGPRRLQMLALYHAGRQAEALRAFQEYRRWLTELVGVEPSSTLTELDRAIARNEVPAAVAGPSIHGYELHERIGEGAFAVVYRGVQPALGREVAIKAIRPELANDPDFIRGFEAEAGTIARLEHPYIVPLYDFWREPDRACLVMRWLHGGSMRSSLDAGPWSLERTSRFIEQIGAALQAAHRARVVHRDVKPANVLLDRDGNTFLADFGIAVERIGDPRTALSEGSPRYASPEQLRREGVGPATDQYALAMTTYEALSGRHPFASAAADPAELLDLTLTAELPPLDRWGVAVPGRVEEVVRTALAKDPDRRFASVEDFVVAFVDATASGSARQLGPASVDRAAGEVSTNPYRGLRAFHEGDADRFYGRERLVGELLDHLGRDRAMLLVGPSGSGKSSVVRAGLLPAVWAGAIEGSERWFTASMSPGARPFEALETALVRIASERADVDAGQLAGDRRGLVRAVRRVVPDDGTEVLLLVDQFEELFTHCDDHRVRRRFLDALVEAVVDEASPFRLVATLRADFYDHPLRHRGFADVVKQHTVTITPLAPDELERAIVAPAATCGVGIEAGLTAEIVAHVASEPGALPLLQYLLTELFDRRDGSMMTRAACDEVGGLAGALGRRAEELWSDSTTAERQIVRRAFSRLVTLGEGSEDTRRRMRRSELGSSDEIDRALDRFAAARLLTFDRDPASREPTVEVAHEALIGAWTRLRSWLDDDRDGLRVLRHLSAAAEAWDNGGRDEADLFRGGRLEAASDWATAHADDLNVKERDFLDSGEALRRREAEAAAADLAAKARQNRRLRRAVVGIGVIAVVALVAGALAYQQQRRADAAAEAAEAAAFTAETERMAADATQLSSRNPRLAFLLAAEAHRRQPGVSTLGALQRVLTGAGPLLGFICGGERFSRVAWASDDEVVAVRKDAVDRMTVEGVRVATVGLTGVRELWSDQHGILATADGHLTELTDDLGVARRQRLPFEPSALTADREHVVVGGRSGDVAVLDRQSLRVLRSWSAHPERTFEELELDDAVREEAQHQPLSAPVGVITLGLAPDGDHLATAGWGRARTWTLDGAMTGEHDLIRRLGEGRSVAVPDGVEYVAGDDGRLIVSARFGAHSFDLATGDETLTTFGGRDTSALEVLGSTSTVVDGVVYSTLSGDTVTVVDAPRGRALEPYEAFLAETLDLAVSPDGRRLAVAGDDGIALLALDGDRVIGRAVPRDGIEFPDVRVPASGEMLLVSIGVEGRSPFVQRLDGDRERVDFDEFEFLFHNGVGHKAALWQEGAPLVLADLDTDERAELSLLSDRTSTVAFDRSESMMAVGSFDGEVVVFDVPEATEIGRFTVGDGLVRNVSISPDGTLVAAADADGAAVVWTHPDGLVERLSNGGGAIVEVGFLPDDDHLATISASGVVAIRSIPGGYQPTGREFIGNTTAGAFGVGPTFSPDGARMVTTVDGSARLWDVALGEQIGVPFPGAGVGISGVSIDARWLATIVDDRIVRWDLDVDAWPEIACRAAGRNMTDEEWAQLGPSDTPTPMTCPEFVG